MITIRRSAERGHAQHGWLDSYHTFSFANYYDPAHMNFSSLRVINDDRIAPGAGFSTHSHSDMEIITYMLSGALEHKDSLGNGSTIRRGEVQRMSAGTGVSHSEYNASAQEPAHLLQIWIMPAENGLTPSYEQQHFDEQQLRGKFRLVVSPDGAADSLEIHQDVRLYAGLLDNAEAIKHTLSNNRCAYMQVANGSLELNGTVLNSGDGAEIENEKEIQLAKGKGAEVLLFDLP